MWGTITKGKIWSGEIKYRDKEGFFHWKKITIVPVLNDFQQYDYVSIQLDITKYKELEKIKEEFVNMAAHEIRGPLSIIKLAFENIISGLYGPLTEQLSKVAQQVSREVDRSIHIATNILSFPQLEDKELLIDSHKINTTQFFLDTSIRFQPVAREQNILINTHIESNLSPICINKDLIIQVVSNLLSNAFRFSRKNILFSTLYTNNLIQTRISDDGQGLSAKDQKKLFMKFTRIGDRIQKGDYKSTGLGLAICKEIIEEVHKGKIWAESTIGKGTQFIFELDTKCRCNNDKTEIVEKSATIS